MFTEASLSDRPEGPAGGFWNQTRSGDGPRAISILYGVQEYVCIQVIEFDHPSTNGVTAGAGKTVIAYASPYIVETKSALIVAGL